MKCALLLKSVVRLGFCAVVGLGLACTHTQSNSSGVFVSARPQVVSPDASGYAVAVPAGQGLRSGQVFALDLQLEQPAYVYVIHRRGGLLGSLYPGVGIADNELRGTVRVPGPDAWMRVPELDRQSHLCVLLSARPLEGQQRRCPEAGRGRGVGQPAVQSFVLHGR